MCHGVQYGIVSSGIGYLYNCYPGLYTRVDIYENFIHGVMLRNCAYKCLYSHFNFILKMNVIVTVYVINLFQTYNCLSYSL